MVVNRIIVGYVVQQYDTEKKKWVSNEFISSDKDYWEDEDCVAIDEPDIDKPYPSTEMYLEEVMNVKDQLPRH